MTTNTSLNRCLLALALAGAALVPLTALAAPFAYVPNEKSGTISVIDTENDTVVAEIKAGDKPRGLAASIDGKTLYVSDQPNNALVKVNCRIAWLTQDRTANLTGWHTSPPAKAPSSRTD